MQNHAQRSHVDVHVRARASVVQCMHNCEIYSACLHSHLRSYENPTSSTQQSVADLVAVARKLDMPLMIADQATHYQDPYHAEHAEFPDRCHEQHGNPCCEDEISAGNLYEEYLDSLNASGVVVGFARCQYIDRRFCSTCNVTKQGLLHYDGTPRPYLTAAVAHANRKYLTTPP